MIAPRPDSHAGDRFALRGLSLQFRDPVVEASYREETLARTLWFCRAAWFLILPLGGSFGLLDRHVFGDNASLVLTARTIVLGVALLVLVATFWRRLRPWLVTSSAVYILLIGSFCTFLVALDDRTVMSPYFAGLFLAYAAIYSTVGVGFRCSLPALILSAVLFLLTVGVLAPVSTKLLYLYGAFTPCVVLVFAYTAWLVERVSRERYGTALRLQETLEELKTLSGMLPICASCKKVRDDQGYWNQIETYISERSEAVFTHGICPTCAQEMYPEFSEPDGDPQKPDSPPDE